METMCWCFLTMPQKVATPGSSSLRPASISALIALGAFVSPLPKRAHRYRQQGLGSGTRNTTHRAEYLFPSPNFAQDLCIGRKTTSLNHDYAILMDYFVYPCLTEVGVSVLHPDKPPTRRDAAYLRRVGYVLHGI